VHDCIVWHLDMLPLARPDPDSPLSIAGQDMYNHTVGFMSGESAALAFTGRVCGCQGSRFHSHRHQYGCQLITFTSDSCYHCDVSAHERRSTIPSACADADPDRAANMRTSRLGKECSCPC
jgi:hypothetical protein